CGYCTRLKKDYLMGADRGCGEGRGVTAARGSESAEGGRDEAGPRGGERVVGVGSQADCKSRRVRG
ncbi:MAG: hypothetical protein Q8M03_01990, partial [Legionella sp.]|nr:hypothetical protein [Legionella sp.]